MEAIDLLSLYHVNSRLAIFQLLRPRVTIIEGNNQDLVREWIALRTEAAAFFLTEWKEFTYDPRTDQPFLDLLLTQVVLTPQQNLDPSARAEATWNLKPPELLWGAHWTIHQSGWLIETYPLEQPPPPNPVIRICVNVEYDTPSEAPLVDPVLLSPTYPAFDPPQQHPHSGSAVCAPVNLASGQTPDLVLDKSQIFMIETKLTEAELAMIRKSYVPGTRKCFLKHPSALKRVRCYLHEFDLLNDIRRAAGRQEAKSRKLERANIKWKRQARLLSDHYLEKEALNQSDQNENSLSKVKRRAE